MRDTAKIRKQAKFRKFMADRGTPMRTLPHETAQAAAKLRDFHARGMTTTAMSEASGVSTSAIWPYMRGSFGASQNHKPVTAMERRCFDLIMAMEFVPPDLNFPDSVRRKGAKIDSTGFKRRLQALIAAGWPGPVIARELGWNVTEPTKLARNGRNRANVYTRTAERVRLVYEKLELADPRDFGATKYQISRALITARNNGYAPPGCWDRESIEDPKALPEWTGRCGTLVGWLIHERENIPVCPRCHKARLDHLGSPKDIPFSPEKFKAIREASGMAIKELARRTGIHDSTIGYWEAGRFQPKRGSADLAASVLDCDIQDFCHTREVDA